MFAVVILALLLAICLASYLSRIMWKTSHSDKVADIQKLVVKAYKSSKPVTTSRTQAMAHTLRTLTYKRSSAKIPVSHLQDILKVDTKRMICVAEPSITFRKVSTELLKIGYCPAVIPEFGEITLGGAVNGLGIESSSFRYGFFHCCCLEYEVVTYDGRLLTVSETENAELFYSLPGAFNTLGILTSITFKIMAAKPYVALTLSKFEDYQAAIKALESKSKDNAIDFLDAIQYKKNFVLIIEGKFSKKNKSKQISQGWWFSQWFAWRVEKELDAQLLMKTEEYLFRYDRGCFWIASYHFPNSWWSRLLFGKITTASSLFYFGAIVNKIFKNTDEYRETTRYVQDYYVPFPKANDLLEYIDSNITVYPLWLCPVVAPESFAAKNLFPYPENSPDSLYLNIGIYGIASVEKNTLLCQKALESKAFQLGGRKWFYAVTYMSSEEFWKYFDRLRYTKVRNQVQAHHTLSIENKLLLEKYK